MEAVSKFVVVVVVNFCFVFTGILKFDHEANADYLPCALPGFINNERKVCILFTSSLTAA